MNFILAVMLGSLCFSAVAFADDDTRAKKFAGAIHLGQLSDTYVTGFDFFYALFTTKAKDSHAGVHGLRLDLDILYSPNIRLKAEPKNDGIYSNRAALAYVTYGYTSLSPIEWYSGIGIEGVYSDVWKTRSSYALQLIYGLEAGAPLAGMNSRTHRVFLESTFHYGHRRASQLVVSSHLFNGLSTAAGIRTSF